MAVGYKPFDFKKLYKKLRELEIPFVIVGGQAVNLWASKYEKRIKGLTSMRPFTSLDLDLYTDSQNAVSKTAKALHCRHFLGDAGSPDIVLGGLWLRSHGNDELLVQFLNGTIGIKKPERIFETSQDYQWEEENLTFPVMHPVLTLESKLRCIYALDQRGRNDLRHLRMAIKYLRCFIEDGVFEGDSKSVLGMIKQVKRICLSTEGVRCCHDYNLKIENSLPIGSISKSREPKLRRFIESEWPVMKNQILNRRRRGKTKPPLAKLA